MSAEPQNWYEWFQRDEDSDDSECDELEEVNVAVEGKSESVKNNDDENEAKDENLSSPSSSASLENDIASAAFDRVTVDMESELSQSAGDPEHEVFKRKLEDHSLLRTNALSTKQVPQALRTSAQNFSISFELALVEIHRPWMDLRYVRRLVDGDGDSDGDDDVDGDSDGDGDGVLS